MPAGFGGLIKLFQRDGQAQLPGALGRAQLDHLAIQRGTLAPLPGLLVSRGEQGEIGWLLQQRRRILLQCRHGSASLPGLQLGTRQQQAQFTVFRQCLQLARQPGEQTLLLPT